MRNYFKAFENIKKMPFERLMDDYINWVERRYWDNGDIYECCGNYWRSETYMERRRAYRCTKRTERRMKKEYKGT